MLENVQNGYSFQYSLVLTKGLYCCAASCPHHPSQPTGQKSTSVFAGGHSLCTAHCLPAFTYKYLQSWTFLFQANVFHYNITNTSFRNLDLYITRQMLHFWTPFTYSLKSKPLLFSNDIALQKLSDLNLVTMVGFFCYFIAIISVKFQRIHICISVIFVFFFDVLLYTLYHFESFFAFTFVTVKDFTSVQMNFQMCKKHDLRFKSCYL